MTNQTIDVTGLTPEQIKQIQKAIETFRKINNSQSILTEEQQVEFEPTPLFFESEILQPSNLELEAINQGSQLTEEVASELANEIDSAVWSKVKSQLFNS